MANFIETAITEFQRYKKLSDEALAQLVDETFFQSPSELSNSPAIIVKHIAGNLQSRWSDFLTTDGEKSNRHRDSEFHLGKDDTRAHLMIKWESSWNTLFQTLSLLEPAHLDQNVSIRGESLTVEQALIRALAHVAYHTGQITYLSRWLNPNGIWLTIPPGKSPTHQAGPTAK